MKRLIAVFGVLAGLLAAIPVIADDDDQRRAWEALRAGEIVSLREILDSVQADYPGEMLEVELEKEHGRWIYEIKQLTPDGRLLKLEFDARTKRLLKARGQGIRHRDEDDD